MDQQSFAMADPMLVWTVVFGNRPIGLQRASQLARSLSLMVGSDFDVDGLGMPVHRIVGDVCVADEGRREPVDGVAGVLRCPTCGH